MAVKGKGIWRLLETKLCATFPRIFAGIAQLVEQLICNQQVVGSNPSAGSITSLITSVCC
jgi:hypothetical protein